jgi:hypothetical protein
MNRVFYQVHVVVMAPGHENIVKATALGVGPKLGVELWVQVVRVLLEVLEVDVAFVECAADGEGVT